MFDIRRCCAYCRHYMNGYCRYRKINVEEDESCRYFEPPKEIPLTPKGDQRLAAVIAKKHMTVFIKGKRGSTDPILKELRRKLKLPPGYRLVKSKAKLGSPLYGAVHIKEAASGRIIKTLYPHDIKKIINASSSSSLHD